MRKWITVLFLFLATTASAQSITLPTYYPSPKGHYNKIRLVPRAGFFTPNDPCVNDSQIGLFYVDNISNQLQLCQDDGSGQGVWATLTDLWTFQDNAGIDHIYDTALKVDTNFSLGSDNPSLGIGSTDPSDFPKITLRGEDDSKTKHSIRVYDNNGKICWFIRNDSVFGIGSDDFDFDNDGNTEPIDLLVSSNTTNTNNGADGDVTDVKIRNTAINGSSQLTFGEGDPSVQGRNMRLRYHSHPTLNSRNAFEIWGYSGHADNDRPLLTMIRDYNPVAGNYASVIVGYPSSHVPDIDYQPTAILEVHSRGTEDILRMESDPDLSTSTENQQIVMQINSDGHVGICNDSSAVASASSTHALNICNQVRDNDGQITYIPGNMRIDYLAFNSDIRQKKEIENISSSIDKLAQLQTVSFHWKGQENAEKKEIGMIAQDVQKVFPELVTTEEQFLSVNYIKLIPHLIKSMQELQSEQIELLNEIEKLEKND